MMDEEERDGQTIGKRAGPKGSYLVSFLLLALSFSTFNRHLHGRACDSLHVNPEISVLVY